MSAETKAPNALPAHVVSAINDYGITCANVVKRRTSPECENWAREKLEDAIRSHLQAPTVVRAGGGVTTERLRELRAECEQRRDEAQASANYHEGSGNDARWQDEANFFAAIRDIIDTHISHRRRDGAGGL